MSTPASATTVPRVPQLVRAHEQVAEHYRTQIRRKRLKAGQDFPSVREIAEAWGGISTNTVYRAVRLLRDEGWIEVSQGRVPTVRGIPGQAPGP